MPTIKPSHIKRPNYRTIHSDVCVNKEHQESADFFLRNSVSTRLRKRAKITYWQLFKDIKSKKIITDDSIQTILVQDFPYAIVTRLRDDANYLFTNFFKPFKQILHTNVNKIVEGIRGRIILRNPKLTNRNFELKTYTIGEYETPNNKKIHILIVNNQTPQAVALILETDYGLIVFRRV